jgi:hypothetical protein
MGTTYEARRDQRIRYVEPVEEYEVPVAVTSIADYRDL